jgi:hypothetical protein
MRDQKYLRKNLHKVNSLFVKEYATKITKRGSDLSKSVLPNQHQNPELRLENQMSINSLANDYAFAGAGIDH